MDAIQILKKFDHKRLNSYLEDAPILRSSKIMTSLSKSSKSGSISRSQSRSVSRSRSRSRGNVNEKSISSNNNP